jgi:BirA family biotin operon repressor/biotin-[acetyl-CoA-carboxylase] ligase
MPRAFDLTPIAEHPFLRSLLFLDETPSTNDVAHQIGGAEALVFPMLILTERQTEGRGRGANRWWSSGGALTFSVVLKAETHGLTPPLWPRVALASAVAICRAVDRWLPAWCGPARIRWPNDVYVAQRKLAGILVEQVGHRAQEVADVSPVDGLIVGIGVNVNNSVAQAPPELAPLAVALVDVCGHTISLTEALLAILDHLDVAIRQLARHDAELVHQWQERCDLVGELVQVQTSKGIVKGLCRGIDPGGQLELQTQGGKVALFSGVGLRPAAH